MQTFEDLVFAPHPYGIGGRAHIFFNNGYGASVVKLDDEETWRTAMLKGTDSDYIITDELDDLSKDQVTEELVRIQSL